MLPLLLRVDTRAAAYDVIVTLEARLDPDQLLGELINKIVCFEWDNNEDETKYMETTALFVIYIELFGKSLEKLKRPKEWMLYLPFLTNFLKRTLDFIEPILIEKSCLSHRERPSSGWDQIILLVVEITLEFTHFVHAVTVHQSPMEFPVTSTDIGSESGDAKRRYLGYFLLNSVFEKVILNFDVQLSKSYYENQHPKYNVNRPNTYNENATHNEYTSRIIQQCIELSTLYGYTYERMLQLLNNINENQAFNFLSAEDEAYENDKQMINQKLYPLTYEGIASLLSLSLYDTKDKKLDALALAKDYIGVTMNLMLRPSEMINHVDKGVFVLLYFSDNIDVMVTMDDIEKDIHGPLGNESFFPVSRILQIISTVASVCPDPSIRFLSYQLTQKFLNFGEEETRIFFLQELLDRCPFPTMKTAAIGLLKGQIDQSFNSEGLKLFKSPMITQMFIPVIFQVNPIWFTKPSEFWNDYNHILQSLNFYYYLLLKDKQYNWVRKRGRSNVCNIIY
ncbi:unnamed protein product [Rhizopus stolonifer]